MKIRMALKNEMYTLCIDLAMLEIDDKAYLNTLKNFFKKNET